MTSLNKQIFKINPLITVALEACYYEVCSLWFGFWMRLRFFAKDAELFLYPIFLEAIKLWNLLEKIQYHRLHHQAYSRYIHHKNMYCSLKLTKVNN
ncbi:hypothetical protein O3M35_003370 [Rhynocoris fuscipes]|uniref:Uncharacterized protein n=1 Tax=Rhynocoris fuscipes TaxID=488301 RepID=A0AAW1CPR8_9HEMI